MERSAASLLPRVATALVVAVLTPPARGEAVRLRNDLAAGVVTVYSVTVRTTRMAPPEGDQAGEVVTYVQVGRLTLAATSPPKHDTIERAWMIELDEGYVETLTRSGRQVPRAELPSGTALGLPLRAAQLLVDEVTPMHAPAHAAGGSPIQQAAFLLALDVAHWPDRTVEPAAQWQHRLGYEFLDVVRSGTLEEIQDQGRKRRARITSEATGTFQGSLQGLAQIVRARSTCEWHVAEHSLLSLTGEVELHYSSDGHPRQLRAEVTLERADRRELSPDDRQAAADEITELSSAVEAYSQGARDAAAKALQKFEVSHPQSLWLPVARDLRHKAQYEHQTLGALGGDELVAVLVQLLAQWQKSAVEGNTESLEPLRTTFADVARTQGEALRELAKAEDPSLRALGVFVLAFGPGDQPLQIVVSACHDPEPTVRAWAIYGLAERQDPQTDGDLILRMLGDTDAKVRQRACQAIERCAPPGAAQRLRFVDALLATVRNDAVEDVRYFAAGGLSRLAGTEHLPAIREASANEPAPKVRKRLKQTVERLENSASRTDDQSG